MKKIVVVIPSYKNIKWYQKNLLSVFTQKYENFRIIYIDDCSPDGTGEAVEKFIQKHQMEGKVTLIRNDKRVGAMENLYQAIHSCEDDEIIVTLDGDDWLAHPQVLHRIGSMYSDPNCWVTYGQYRSWPDNGRGCSRQIPDNIINSNGYRQYAWCSSHLRTFYTWLFKRIKKEDFLDSHGKFYTMAWDLSIYFPLLEMAGPRAKFVPDVLYIYNVANPINDSKVNLQLQQGLEQIIRHKSKYPRL